MYGPLPGSEAAANTGTDNKGSPTDAINPPFSAAQRPATLPLLPCHFHPPVATLLLLFSLLTRPVPSFPFHPFTPLNSLN